MKELAQINYELREGFVPEKLYYVSPINDRRLYMKHFPRGFMSLPNAEKIIDRMMIRAKIERVLQMKLQSINA